MLLSYLRLNPLVNFDRAGWLQLCENARKINRGEGPMLVMSGGNQRALAEGRQVNVPDGLFMSDLKVILRV